MKRSIIAICLATTGVVSSVSAATVQLMPPMTGITGAGMGGKTLAGSGITANDVNAWLGSSSSKADGWYSTTGNGDMQWGFASVNVDDQTLRLPSMPGTGGVCAGLKMSLPDMSSYDHLEFSFTLTPPANSANYTYSIWYGNKDGSVTALSKQSGSYSTGGGAWNASYSFSEDQIAGIKNNGDGKLYVVIGSTGGSNGQAAIISNFSLNGTEIESVPEASTSLLFLLGISSLMLRRRVKA